MYDEFLNCEEYDYLKNVLSAMCDFEEVNEEDADYLNIELDDEKNADLYDIENIIQDLYENNKLSSAHYDELMGMLDELKDVDD